jgi:dihydropteroate synthase
MGILNVTPDSFSDGGEYLAAEHAIAHGLQLIGEGADMVDIGGESTRPGAEPVAEQKELERVLPVIEGLRGRGATAQLSIDTAKAGVARAAIAAGVTLVNDVTAFRGDPEMAALVADAGCDCCLMHMQGEPRTMQVRVGGSTYEDVVDDVRAFLSERIEFAIAQGIAPERIMVDPGIGFGKTVAHNLELLGRLEDIAALGPPVVIGTSRKSFLGRLIADVRGKQESAPPSERLPGTLASNVLAYERGARVFRVHDVAPVRDALAVTAATLGERWTQRPTETTRTT